MSITFNKITQGFNVKFKVGDKVKIIDDKNYAFTKKGSVGFIKFISEGKLHIKFIKITGCNGDIPSGTFPIQSKHVAHLTKLEKSLE
jgi:hypothetical protein